MTVSPQMLTGVVVEVLETMAFACVLGDDAEPDDQTAAFRASVAFGGSAAGSLMLSAPREVAAELAGAMLCQEGPEPPSEQQQRDALGELANITCGNLLPQVFGNDSVFRLDRPEVVDGRVVAGADAGVCLQLDSGWVHAEFRTKSPDDGGGGGM